MCPPKPKPDADTLTALYAELGKIHLVASRIGLSYHSTRKALLEAEVIFENKKGKTREQLDNKTCLFCGKPVTERLYCARPARCSTQAYARRKRELEKVWEQNREQWQQEAPKARRRFVFVSDIQQAKSPEEMERIFSDLAAGRATYVPCARRKNTGLFDKNEAET